MKKQKSQISKMKDSTNEVNLDLTESNKQEIIESKVEDLTSPLSKSLNRSNFSIHDNSEEGQKGILMRPGEKSLKSKEDIRKSLKDSKQVELKEKSLNENSERAAKEKNEIDLMLNSEESDPDILQENTNEFKNLKKNEGKQNVNDHNLTGAENSQRKISNISVDFQKIRNMRPRTKSMVGLDLYQHRRRKSQTNQFAKSSRGIKDIVRDKNSLLKSEKISVRLEFVFNFRRDHVHEIQIVNYTVIMMYTYSVLFSTKIIFEN